MTLLERRGLRPLPTWFGTALAASIFLFVTAFPEAAQHPVPSGTKSYRVGIVLPGDEWLSSVEGMKEGMKTLGYVEGKEIYYLFENAKGDKKKVAEMTRRFVGERVDAIFTITNTALKVVAAETRESKTPVIFGSASGPVESGIIPAYATPDSHITGVTSNSIELVGKRLEILKEVLPQVRRVAVIGDRDADSSIKAFAIAKATAPKVRLSLVEIKAGSKEEAIEAAKKLSRSDADAIFLIPSLHVVGSTPEIAAAARAARLPFVVYQIEHVEKNGALIGYGSSYFLQGKQSAKLLSKVLKGVKPGAIPIETPERFVLTLNLVIAKAIGLKIPRDVLARADRTVE